MINKEVTVKRNIIEQALMNLKDFISTHKDATIKLVTVAAIIILSCIALIAFVDYKINKDTSDFEAVLDEYRTTYSVDEQEQKTKFLRTVNKLQSIVDRSYFGYVHRNGYYVIASLYFSQKDYNNAAKFFEKAAKYCSPLLASLALQQAGIAAEYNNNVDQALQYYLLCESKYKDGYNRDQILYNIGRLYSQKGQYLLAKEYFAKVATEYPQSLFAKKATQYSMFLGAIEKENKN